mmetsp:Transcript_111479/g.218464  ORF Transcript_111479/g.218464 Transcript_111479/m.218464 type:complete len:211 (-) Transcript_111479:105-737(-)
MRRSAGRHGSRAFPVVDGGTKGVLPARYLRARLHLLRLHPLRAVAVLLRPGPHQHRVARVLGGVRLHLCDCGVDGADVALRYRPGEPRQEGVPETLRVPRPNGCAAGCHRHVFGLQGAVRSHGDCIDVGHGLHRLRAAVDLFAPHARDHPSGPDFRRHGRAPRRLLLARRLAQGAVLVLPCAVLRRSPDQAPAGPTRHRARGQERRRRSI